MTALTDALRLLAVPVFAWVAWQDYRTRRVPARTWYPLAVLGVVLLVLDTGRFIGTPQFRLFLIRVALSLGIIIPLSIVFRHIGGFGGADAKAFMVLAVVFPIYPVYPVGDLVLPLIVPTLGVFSLTIITNGVIAGLLYPLALATRNVLDQQLHPRMFIAKPVHWTDLETEYGAMFIDALPNESRGLLGAVHPSKGRLDLDALRMYLRWRDATLGELRNQPTLRDPATLPSDPHPPTDGAIKPDGGTTNDAWGANAFIEDVGNAYGTTPAELRAGLDTITDNETVWVSPGIPFLVPVFLGLVLGLIYGDILFVLLGHLGVL